MAAITSAIIVGVAVAAASTAAWGVVAGVAMFALNKAMTPDIPDAADGLQGDLLVTKMGADGHVPVIYGTRRTGGIVVYDNIKDGNNKKRGIVIALGRGPVESVSSIKIDDTPITSNKFSGYVQYEVLLGDDDQQSSQLMRSHFGDEPNQPWTVDHRCRGTALLCLVLERDMQGEKVSPNPSITAVVKGRKVAHPHLPTMPDGSYQMLYSENPILHGFDFMTNPIYGLGAAEEDCNISRLIEDITYCEQLREVNGEFIPMYSNNMIIDTSASLKSNMQRIMDQCLGTIINVGSKYELVADKPTNPVMHLTEDHIVGGISCSDGDANKAFNVIEGRYTNPKADWNNDTVVIENDDLFQQDGYVENRKEISFHGCTSKLECHVLCSAAVIKSRMQEAVAFTTNHATEFLRVFDVIELSSPVIGYNKKQFRINEITHNTDGTNRIQASVYGPAMYTYLGDLTGFVDNVYTPARSRLFDINPPQNFSFEQLSFKYNGSGKLTWAHPDSFSADRYIIDYKLSSEADTEYVQLAETSGLEYIVTNMKASSYDFRIRAVSLFGLRSDFAYVTSAVVDNFITMPPVENLRSVTGTSEFKKPDCTIIWDEVTDQAINAANTYTSSEGQETVAAYLRNYEIEVYNGDTQVFINRFVSTSPQFTYTFEQNSIDNGTPIRKLLFKVYAVSKSGFKSTARQKTLTNFQQAKVVPVVSVEGQAITVNIAIPSIDDYLGTDIHVSTVNGFAPDETNKVGTVTNTDFFQWPAPDIHTTYYVKCGSYDVFDKAGITYSDQQSVTSFEFQTTPPDLNYIDTALVPKTDANGRVTGWGAIEDQTGPFSPVTLVSGALQIWNDLDTAIPPFSVENNQVYIDSALIKDATIDSAKISSVNANTITSGTVDAARIGANSIDSTKIDSRNLTIKDGSGNVIFGSGYQFNGATYIQSGTIGNAQIANAAINNAKIADASINTAKIVDASVDTLKIKGQAVTIPASTYTASEASTSGTATASFLTYTSSGAPLNVFFSVHVRTTASVKDEQWSIGAKLQVFVDGVKRYEVSGIASDSGTQGGSTSTKNASDMVSGALKITPSYGTTNVEVKVLNVAGGSCYFKNRSLVCLEVKR